MRARYGAVVAEHCLVGVVSLADVEEWLSAPFLLSGYAVVVDARHAVLCLT